MTFQLILLIIFCSGITAGLSFLAGIVFEKWWTASALERATKKVSRAAEHLIKSLEQSQKIASRVAGLKGKKLDQPQLDKVTSLHQQLNSTLDKFLSAYLHPENSMVSNQPIMPFTTPAWVMSPRDYRTELPDYTAAMQNLTLFTEHVKQQGDGSIMLIQIDRFDDLGKRYGDLERTSLLKNLSQLVIRHMRESDLLCHLHDDVLLLFLPWVADDELSITIRDTVKSHRFYLEKNRAEVIVTASMGLYTLTAGDAPQLALERATSALVASRKKGRNQLMQHNGRTMLTCKAC